MRTTVSISDNLLKEAKRVALDRNVSLGAVIDDALRMSLQSRSKPIPPGKVRPLKTFRGSGLRPGVDLNNSQDLIATMEDE